MEGEVGKGPATSPGREIDTYAVSGARALRRAGWSDARIAGAYGGMPPIHMSLAEILDHNARVGTPERARATVDDEVFQGNP